MIATALTSAETGHLVLATLHTPDAAQTIQRIYGAFPAEQQNHIIYQLSNSLQGNIAQNLLLRADGRASRWHARFASPRLPSASSSATGEAHLIANEIIMGREHHGRGPARSLPARRDHIRRCDLTRARSAAVEAQNRMTPLRERPPSELVLIRRIGIYAA